MRTSRGTNEVKEASDDVTSQSKRRRVEKTNTYNLWKQGIAHFVDSSIATRRGTATVDNIHHPSGMNGEMTQEQIMFYAYRVLRACWLFRGNPGDTFEPVRSMNAVIQSLLIEYGGYSLTNNTQYLVLRGEERMTRVGFLLFVLHQLLMEHCGFAPLQSQPQHQLNTRRELSCTHQTGPFAGEMELCVVTVSGDLFNGCGVSPNRAGNLQNRQMLLMQESLRSVVRAVSPGVILMGSTALTPSDLHSLAEHDLHAECFTTQHYNGDSIACFVPSRTGVWFTGRSVGATTGTTTITGDDVVDFEDCLQRAVSCGSRRTRHVIVHAVLLSPMGPLLIHADWYNRGGDNNKNSVCNADDESLHLWLSELLQAPQPRVIVQCGRHNGIPTDTTMHGKSILPLPLPTTATTTATTTTTTTTTATGTVTVTVDTAAVSVRLGRELEVPAGCQVWRLKMSPHT